MDRRQRILTAAATLFARKGVSATTVREIADQAGILSGSLYHHFDSKESMVDEVISPYLQDLRSRYKKALAGSADPRVRLHDLILASLEVVEAHPHATEIYQNDVNYLSQFDRFAYLKTAGREVQSIWLEVINAGIRAGVFRSDLDAKVVYRLMRDAVWLSVRWYRPTNQYPMARLAQQCTSLFVDGLASA
jgi:AcrR family transcriptional regulator